MHEDVLALNLAGNKFLFASRQGRLGFALVSDVARLEDVVLKQLQQLELARSTELGEQAPHVVSAIRQCAV